MMTLKKLAKQALRRTGFTIFRPGKLPVGSDYRITLAEAGLAPATVVDVGANVGQFSLHLTEFFPAATIYAFEPISTTFAQLVRNTAASGRVRCFELACAAQAGEVEVFLQNHSVTNTLEPGRNVQTAPDQLRQIVRTVRLDSFCSEQNLRSLDLLKVDAEGFDLEVLHGAQRLLDEGAIKMVLVEVTFDPDQEGVSQFGPISDFLATKGFKLSGLYNQTAGGPGHYLVFADALFTHQGQ